MKHIKQLMQRRSEWIRLLLNSRNIQDEKQYREKILELDKEIDALQPLKNKKTN